MSVDLRGLRFDFHPCFYFSNACGCECSLTDIDAAEAADTHWVEFRIVAQRGNVDAGRLSCIKYGRAFRDFNGDSVDAHSDHGVVPIHLIL